MKKLILIVLFLPVLMYSQENRIFFDISEEVLKEVDSIVFQGKNVDILDPIYRVKNKKRIKFIVYKNNKSINYIVQNNYLDRYNTVFSIAPDKSNASSIVINRGHTKTTLIQKKCTTSMAMEIKIRTLVGLIDKEGNLDTGSETFNYYISKHPGFFY